MAQGIKLKDLRSKTIETDVDLNGEKLHIVFHPDFFTAEMEEDLRNPAIIFISIAKNLAKYITDWDLLIDNVDENGNYIDLDGNPLPEFTGPISVKAPITEEFCRKELGSDLLQAIHSAMFRATNPNTETSSKD